MSYHTEKNIISDHRVNEAVYSKADASKGECDKTWSLFVIFNSKKNKNKLKILADRFYKYK